MRKEQALSALVHLLDLLLLGLGLGLLDLGGSGDGLLGGRALLERARARDHGAEELVLLGLGLEATVAELGRRVDPLELDVLERHTLGLRQQRLAQGQDALLGADNATLCCKNHSELKRKQGETVAP